MVARLSEKQRIEILIMVGCGDKIRSQQEVCDLFHQKYPDQRISRATISKISKKFEETGSIKDLPGSGRQRTVSENDRQNVMLAVTENPHSSIRSISANFNLSKSSVHRILKSEKWHPYKVNVLQELWADDTDRRLQFCEEIRNLFERQPNLKHHIIFTDEATFCLNGTVNKQNTRFWSPENPHWMQEKHTQRPVKINVWAGIVGNRILGPYFFEGNLTGDIYLDFLRFELIPALEIIFPNPNEHDMPAGDIWFQQDGAPPHFRLDVRNYLNEVFPNRWIGRRGPLEWPPRSPDLTPLDFFVGLFKKQSVCK